MNLSKHHEIEPSGKTLDLTQLKLLPTNDLVNMGQELEIENADTMVKKQNLLFQILKHAAYNGDKIIGAGVLDVLNDGFGFLRAPETNYLSGPDDIYVSPSHIRKLGLEQEIVLGRNSFT